MSEQNYRIRIKLSGLEIEAEGDKRFVIENIEKYKKEMQLVAEELRFKEDKEGKKEEESEFEKLSLAEFYKKKQPKDYNETVTIFSYWITKRKGVEGFAPKDIESLFSEIGAPKPANIPQIMKTLAGGKKAHLVRAGNRGLYKISLLGIDFVENKLPRRSEG
jgi:hypothetical protein